MPQQDSSSATKQNHQFRCTHCGGNMRRLHRRGAFQKFIFAFFGYYPWECPVCREPVLIRAQYKQKRTHPPAQGK